MSNLKDLRVKAVLSQRELAEKSGVSLNSICRIETGKQIANFQTIKKLAVALNVPPTQIDR